jgi:hypothetical protein
MVCACLWVFALVWIVLRARIQSITIDEATTYDMFVARGLRFVFLPAANNHVLNSLLMLFSTRIFGVSQLTASVPALLGAIA